MHVLGISGSLRVASINSALLRVAARLAPDGLSMRLCDVIGALPLFNPEIEPHVPPTVAALYEQVAGADALLIASPEYAHGVSGVMKNTLDWLVSFEPFVHMPVGVLNAAVGSTHADAALRETLRTMSAVVVDAASVRLALIGAERTEVGMHESPRVSGLLRDALLALQQASNVGRVGQRATSVLSPYGPRHPVATPLGRDPGQME